MNTDARKWPELEPRKFSSAETASAASGRWEKTGSGFIARYRIKTARGFLRSKLPGSGNSN